MIIEVKLFSTLRHYLPNSHNRVSGDKWDITEGGTVAEVLEMLNIPFEEARVILKNGRKADMETVLNDGDVLHVFPPMVGG